MELHVKYPAAVENNYIFRSVLALRQENSKQTSKY